MFGLAVDLVISINFSPPELNYIPHLEAVESLNQLMCKRLGWWWGW